MDDYARKHLTQMIGAMTQAFDNNDTEATPEDRAIWQLDAATIQAYASCQTALQLDRIARTLEALTEIYAMQPSRK